MSKANWKTCKPVAHGWGIRVKTWATDLEHLAAEALAGFRAVQKPVNHPRHTGTRSGGEDGGRVAVHHRRA
ncbi:hypothetical protein [Sinomonas susongensis]|uniref:hypothetical protein n=1 Tax=Sinomonas susongensis TaxID=1324851 RepID=UPI001107CC16|nr:hypothetical protein [Sinomonas susongensis]